MYQLPNQKIIDLVEAAKTPSVSISPSKEWMLLLSPAVFPSVEELAQKEYRLAGVRINPQTNGPSRANYYESCSLLRVTDQKRFEIKGLTGALKMNNIQWAPDSHKIAFTHTTTTGISLWQIDLATFEAQAIPNTTINDVMPGYPYKWLSNAKQIIFKGIDVTRGELPIQTREPEGPIIKESTAKVAPVRTYQDLLKNTYDKLLFEYYTRAQLKMLDSTTHEINDFAAAGMIQSFDPAPGGAYVFVQYLQKPFSYVVPYTRFPFVALVYDLQGKKVREVAKVALAEHVPNKFGAVRKGARAFQWRADVAASLYWVETQDDGDPKKEVAVRDILFCLSAPFLGSAKASLSFQLRYGGIHWGNDAVAISYQWTWENRRMVTKLWSPKAAPQTITTLFDLSWENEYDSPGRFAFKRNQFGRNILALNLTGEKVLLFGKGASPEGNRPFIDELNVKNQKIARLWRSQAPFYEQAMAVIDVDQKIFLIKKETTESPANFFIKNLTETSEQQLTQFENPYANLLKVKKQLLRYQRADGVELSGTLYLPANYDLEKDGRLPVLMWAYPKEFKSRSAASQLKASPYEFMRFGWSTPLFWVTQGYAIFDDFSMPVIGEEEKEPNEEFISQLVAGAEAAINFLVEMGVADRNRIAVGGHSYGAFMTANLLAHSDLFAAGIARSGAYNRTLTPFGFQAEERSLWEAPETYIKMSPFMYANQIKTPLLLIHGEADNNAGTYPMQSERFFSALKGHGAKVRLVMLPHESHSYKARESILHMLWEISRWLDLHVKNKQEQLMTDGAQKKEV